MRSSRRASADAPTPASARQPRCNWRATASTSASPGIAEVVDELADALGGVDVLVNNSGTSRRGKAVDLSYDDRRHTLSVDLDGAFLCAQRAARRMIAQGRGGRIVNVISVHEYTPISEGVAYTTAKHGLGGLMLVNPSAKPQDE